jgi:integration host factor subunit beta
MEWPKQAPFDSKCQAVRGEPVVTKKEIVKTISEAIGMTQLKTKEIVQKTFDAIVETLVEEKRIELRNFGVFEVKERAARKARNPRTGQRVDVPEKFVVTFKPGKEMEEKVRQLEAKKRASQVGAAPMGSNGTGAEVPRAIQPAPQSSTGT